MTRGGRKMQILIQKYSPHEKSHSNSLVIIHFVEEYTQYTLRQKSLTIRIDLPI